MMSLYSLLLFVSGRFRCLLLLLSYFLLYFRALPVIDRFRRIKGQLLEFVAERCAVPFPFDHFNQHIEILRKMGMTAASPVPQDIFRLADALPDGTFPLPEKVASITMEALARIAENPLVEDTAEILTMLRQFYGLS